MKYDPDKVLTAWKAFVGQGIILEENLQPEVARSWERCKKAGLDPWSVNFTKPSKELLQKKRKEYKMLIERAHPVLEYLLAIFNCNLSLCDPDGFIYELITPLGYYPRTYGTFMEEEIIGNGSITLTLHEKKPSRLDGYEHYRSVSQRYSGVSAPIVAKDRLLGVLTITNPFNTLPDFALDCCICAAEIIANLIIEGNRSENVYKSGNLLGKLIEKSKQTVMVLDSRGRILLANSVATNIIMEYKKMPYGERSIKDYLVDKNDIKNLVDFKSGADESKIIRFKSTKYLKDSALKLISRREIFFANGTIHIVLVFQSPIKEEVKTPKRILRNPDQTVDYIGNSDAWNKIDRIVRKVADFKTNVLLLGETGTGKEVVARGIHRLSGRSGNFVPVNCGAIPKELLASELFGYESGAFTGAKVGGAEGKFEYADGGTLFLDEIGEMPLDMQVSLLRVIQEKTITRVGSNRSQPCDVRIVAATNQNMRKVIEAGEFRSDLYYRLSVIEIKLPLLKERKDDIPLLADFFNGVLSEELQIPKQHLSKEVTESLLHYDWPGNVRELKNVMEKLLILSEGSEISVDLLPDYITDELNIKTLPLSDCPQEHSGTERERICLSLEKHQGNISQVAKELGMARNTIYRKIEKYNITMKTYTLKNN